jgi:hypothetical protein
MYICSNCASRIKTKEAEGYEFKICKCNYCNQRGYCASESAWGISTTPGKEVGDEGVEYLKSLFNMK